MARGVWGLALKVSTVQRANSGIHAEDPLNQSNRTIFGLCVYEPGYAFYNTGFRGMGVENNAEYRLQPAERRWAECHSELPLRTKKAISLVAGKLGGIRQSLEAIRDGLSESMRRRRMPG